MKLLYLRAENTLQINTFVMDTRRKLTNYLKVVSFSL